MPRRTLAIAAALALLGACTDGPTTPGAPAPTPLEPLASHLDEDGIPGCAGGIFFEELPAMDPGLEGTVRSEASDTPFNIVFVNTTCQTLKLYWLDFDGARQFYQDLEPGENPQSTFVGHPWLITSASGRPLAIFAPDPEWGNDEDGDGVLTAHAVYLNQDPELHFDGPHTAVEGVPVTFRAISSFDPEGGPLLFDWIFFDAGGGFFEGVGPTVTYTFEDGVDDLETILIFAYEPEAANGCFCVGFAEAEIDVMVRNAPPVVRLILLDFPVLNRPRAGAMWPISFRWLDRGGDWDSPWDWRIEWGDGKVDEGTKDDQSQIDAAHAYATPGTYDGRLVITDVDGGRGVRTFRVVVGS